MEYVNSPQTIKIKDIHKSGFSLTASKYKKIINLSPNQKTLRELLDRKLDNSIDKGIEVGSVNYIETSPYKFVRTKSLEIDSFLPNIDDSSILSLLPSSYKDYALKQGDVLISKDSNIGETVILDKDYPNHMISGGLYRLPITRWKYYFLAFAKSGYFKTELEFLASRGATIKHAKTLFLDCIIPFPNQYDQEQVIKYIELLVQSLIRKEVQIKNRHAMIINTIDNELNNNQKINDFNFKNPSIKEIFDGKRIDAGFYGEEYKKIMFLLTNYTNGYDMLDKQGLNFIPGSSLEIKLLGTRIDSSEPKDGFYRIVTPKQITNYGTVTSYEYLGTPRAIPSLQKGDIVFGESGTGRSFVYLGDHMHTITNAHGHVLRPVDCSLDKAITIRCILAYLKENGFIDLLTVGGAGGHLSPSYFGRVAIPRFKQNTQQTLAVLYHNDVSRDYLSKVDIDGFSEEDEAWCQRAGITELDDSIKKIKEELVDIINNIVSNNKVEINFRNIQ